MKTFIVILAFIAACFADNIMVRQAVQSEHEDQIEMGVVYTGDAVDIVSARAYQIDFTPDSILIYDGNRLVGTIPAFDTSELCKLLWKDNE